MTTVCEDYYYVDLAWLPRDKICTIAQINGCGRATCRCRDRRRRILRDSVSPEESIPT